MKSSDQKEIEKFIKELVDNVTSRYSKEIDFVILYGSAARGEFVKGASDIDLVIQLKKDSKRKEIEKYATDVFWKLDKKYGFGFSKYLANSPSNNLLVEAFRKVENSLKLYTPIFVLSRGDLDWENARVLKTLWIIPSLLIVSTGTMFLKFKREGKVYFGRDITKEIPVRLGLWERWKAICIPIYLSIVSIVTLPISRKNAVKYSVKAVLWGIDSALLFVGENAKGKKEQIRKLKKLTNSEKRLSVESSILRLAIDLKYRLIPEKSLKVVGQALIYKRKKPNLNFYQSLKFVLQVFLFLTFVNNIVILKSVFSLNNQLAKANF